MFDHIEIQREFSVGVGVINDVVGFHTLVIVDNTFNEYHQWTRVEVPFDFAYARLPEFGGPRITL